MRRKHKKIDNIRYNDNFVSRSKFLLETLITLPIGALAAFVFEQNIRYALIALVVFIVLFIGYCTVLVFEDTKVSVLSIMKDGLKDGRYEDVIKFGSAMSPTLFTSNKNFDRVTLGRLLLEACNGLSSISHSAREDILITTGGTVKPVKQIKIELLLDDLGWSLYLADSNNNEATSNIQEGIRKARREIQRIRFGHSGDPASIAKDIEVYMKLILRGYRHLTGIYYTKSKSLDLAQNYEKITQYILSGGRILAYGGACTNRFCVFCVPNLGGMFCQKGKKQYNCIRNNIRDIFFSDLVYTEKIKLNQYIDFTKLQTSEDEVVQDRDNYLLLSELSKLKLLQEQSYAWSRNTVKLLQKSIRYGWGKPIREKDGSLERPFVSDEERNCKLVEAIAFARLYYYGKKFISEEYDKTDFEKIISEGVNKKEQQRYLSLLNEIDLLDDTSNKADVGSYDERIETLITHINMARDACRGLRADLFARNTSFLIKAYLLNYNLNYRYRMGDENTRSERTKRIRQIRHDIKGLKNEVTKYEHADNEEVTKVYKAALKELHSCKRELKSWRFKKKRSSSIPKTYRFDSDNSIEHISYSARTDMRILGLIKERWKVNDQ